MKPSFALARSFAPTPMRILLAEDDAEFRSFLAEVLRDDGYVVEAVGDGGELVERIAQAISDGDELHGIDLILSDIRMPHCNALEILKGIRDARLVVPVLLMTGFGDRTTEERAKLLGAIGVLNKPFDIDDLRTVVCNVLSGQIAGWSRPANEG
jgi:two-component system, response regulator, stage 0 sporulation protein F